MFAGLHIQAGACTAQIGPAAHQPFQIFAVKAGFDVRNLTVTADIHPYMLQIVQMLNIVIIINSVFYDSRNIRPAHLKPAPEGRGSPVLPQYRHAETDGVKRLVPVKQQTRSIGGRQSAVFRA
ncbi:hypothetical protein D3C80_1310840 [compost metagenome]